MRIGSIEAGGTKFVCAIGDENGNILERISFPTEDPQSTLENITNFFINKEIKAVGVGSFGPIDLNKKSKTYGYIKNTPKILWQNFNLLGELKKIFTVPVFIDTDVNIAALGEMKWGNAIGSNSCLYLTVGTGIGGGIIVDKNTIQGLNHPEVGHITLKKHPQDTYEGKCPFHKDYCLEGLASGPAIEARWNKKASQLPPDHFAWELEAYYLAQALSNYILILAPEKIVLGGGVMKQSQIFPKIRKYLNEFLNNYLSVEYITNLSSDYIVPPKLGDNAGICGGIVLALNNL